ncbi:MAG: hypothetical protein E7Y34_02055, partial [Mycoplasma sp.]|nr:hypothetical protein [Mycoplasma sp.]
MKYSILLSSKANCYTTSITEIIEMVCSFKISKCVSRLHKRLIKHIVNSNEIDYFYFKDKDIVESMVLVIKYNNQIFLSNNLNYQIYARVITLMPENFNYFSSDPIYVKYLNQISKQD